VVSSGQAAGQSVSGCSQAVTCPFGAEWSLRLTELN
jgi:hypothetical protein